MGFGARYISEDISNHPRGYRFSINAGVPIRKQGYKFPIYRAFESEISDSKLLKNLQVFIGLDYTPSYFLGLPELNKGYQIIENESYSLKLGIGYAPTFLDKRLNLRIKYLRDVVSKSSLVKNLNANSFAFTAFYQHIRSHGFEFNIESKNISGDIKVSSLKSTFSYVYKFEN